MTRRWRPVVWWLVPAGFYWVVLAVVARIPATGAARLTNVLFVPALALSYCAIVGAIVQSSVRPRRARLRAAAVTLGLILALAVLELAAALRLVHWESVFVSLRGEQQPYVPDADLGFRHTPNSRWSGRQRSDIETAWGLPASTAERISITHDARGYRNPTNLTRADIILLGDSYVEGAHVSDDQVVSRFLQARLGRPVANLGVAGYGTAQELLVLERDGMSLKPSIVVWFFFEGNDLYDDQSFENTLLVAPELRATAWSQRYGWWRRSLIRNAHSQLRLMLHQLVPSQCRHFGILEVGDHRGQKILFGPEAAFPWTDFERGRWEKTRETLRAALRLARTHEIHLLLVYVPIKFRVYRESVRLPPQSELHGWTLWPLPELFQQLCRSERMACLDLTGPLGDAVRAGGMPYAPTDSHWSAEGHQLVARRVHEVLAEIGWISEAPVS